MKSRTIRELNRRSFLSAVGGGVWVGGALLVIAESASAQSARPRRGYGHAGRRTQSAITDGDKNPADVTGARGCTDHDTGRNADRPTAGRGTGLNDNDRESGRPRARQYGDPANCGRHRARR